VLQDVCRYTGCKVHGNLFRSKHQDKVGMPLFCRMRQARSDAQLLHCESENDKLAVVSHVCAYSLGPILLRSSQADSVHACAGPANCNVHLKGIALVVTHLRHVYIEHTCKPCNVLVTPTLSAALIIPMSRATSGLHQV
jgi:hypothetical protein